MAAPPTSQTAATRPISFLLQDDSTGGGPVEPVTLVIRPEDLTRQEPSRLNVQQTLGGAWADSFGAGIAQITIAGHTGWNRSIGYSQQSSNEDGEARFARLRDQVFAQWHARREAATKIGRDPNGVQLIFADNLDNIAAVVAPQAFVLRRSRSRPLLMQYQIQLTVLSDSVGAPVGGGLLDGVFGSDILQSLGLESLGASIDQIASYAKDITGFIDKTIGAPVKQFMLQTETLFRRVDSAVRSVDGVASSLISVAQQAARAGMNIFRTIGAVASLPQRVLARTMQVATAYMNIFCVLRNAIATQSFYDDFSPLYGASNCSSTRGGRPLSPLANENPFYTVSAPLKAPVTLTTEAQFNLKFLVGTDPALNPVPLSSLAGAVSSITQGLSFS